MTIGEDTIFSCNSPEIKPRLSHPYIQTLIVVIHDLSRDISQELQLLHYIHIVCIQACM